MKTAFQLGLQSSYDHVFGSVRGLHYPLAEERSTAECVTQLVYVANASCSMVGTAALWRARKGLKLRLVPGKIRLTQDGKSLVPKGTQIPYSAIVDLVAWLTGGIGALGLIRV
ncbi:hypothetical protein M9H77_27201 [Catharanthus roseus]|uniref:Uncharacterized protein n=1 Tax=Catharanthus roseus TaxID=4058 RepID=A0ACC0ABU5_CATRO|nr:hypothetical protein M9H77_27201 [Catharanthus roseus]